MLAKLPKILAALAAIAGIGVTIMFLLEAKEAVTSLGESSSHEAAAGGEGHGAEAAADAPGGGHGGGGEHGKPADAADAAASLDGGAPTVNLDEIFTNIIARNDELTHTVGIKLDIELFGEEGKPMMDAKAAGVKNTIIMATREQIYEDLNSISGKLFYKEILVSKINEFFAKAIVRDIHFASFYVQ